MTGLAILVALAASGVDFGWQPTSTGLEFILQLEPAVAQSLLSGDSRDGVVSVTPSELRGSRLNRLRVLVGESRLPQAFRQSVANQRVTPRGVLEVGANSVDVGWRPSTNNGYELIVQLSPAQMEMLAAGEIEVVIDFPEEVQAQGVRSFRILVGAQRLRRVSFSAPTSQSASPPVSPPGAGAVSPPNYDPAQGSNVMGASAMQNADDYRDPNRRPASPIADPAYRDGRPPQSAPLPDLYSDPYNSQGTGAADPYDSLSNPAANPADRGRFRTQIGPENPQDYRGAADPAGVDPRDLRVRNRQISDNIDSSLLNDPRLSDPRVNDVRGQSDIYGPGFPDDPRYQDNRNYAETLPPDPRASDPLAVDPRRSDPRRVDPRWTDPRDPRDPRAANARLDPRDPRLNDPLPDYRDYPAGVGGGYASDDPLARQPAYPNTQRDYAAARDYRGQAPAVQPAAPANAAPASPPGAAPATTSPLAGEDGIILKLLATNMLQQQQAALQQSNKPAASEPVARTTEEANPARFNLAGAGGVAWNDPNAPKPWMPLVMATLGLFASLGANAYLAWIAWSFYERYRDLLLQVRER